MKLYYLLISILGVCNCKLKGLVMEEVSISNPNSATGKNYSEATVAGSFYLRKRKSAISIFEAPDLIRNIQVSVTQEDVNVTKQNLRKVLAEHDFPELSIRDIEAAYFAQSFTFMEILFYIRVKESGLKATYCATERLGPDTISLKFTIGKSEGEVVQQYTVVKKRKRRGGIAGFFGGRKSIYVKVERGLYPDEIVKIQKALRSRLDQVLVTISD